jgi:hypothetical protein
MVGWKEGVSGVGNRVYETFDASPTREYGGLIPSVNRARQQDRIAREKDKKSSKKEESTVVQHLADAQTKLSTLAQKKNDAGKVTIGSVSQQTSTPVTFTDQEREKVEKSGQGNVREPETKKDAKPAAKSAPASASANAQTSSDAVVGVQSPNKDDKDKPAHPHH